MWCLYSWPTGWSRSLLRSRWRRSKSWVNMSLHWHVWEVALVSTCLTETHLVHTAIDVLCHSTSTPVLGLFDCWPCLYLSSVLNLTLKLYLHLIPTLSLNPITNHNRQFGDAFETTLPGNKMTEDRLTDLFCDNFVVLNFVFVAAFWTTIDGICVWLHIRSTSFAVFSLELLDTSISPLLQWQICLFWVT